MLVFFKMSIVIYMISPVILVCLCPIGCQIKSYLIKSYLNIYKFQVHISIIF